MHLDAPRSSITIPDVPFLVFLLENSVVIFLELLQVRYVLDFGIVRKMVFDEERAMQCAWQQRHMQQRSMQFARQVLLTYSVYALCKLGRKYKFV